MKRFLIFFSSTGQSYDFIFIFLTLLYPFPLNLPLSEYYYLGLFFEPMRDVSCFRWDELDPMPTARRACAAISIPRTGILVVGGSKRTGLDSEGMSLCELLIIEKRAQKWKQFPFMLHSRVIARGVYHNQRVYVTSFNDLTIDMLTIKSGESHGQWTLLAARNCPQDKIPWSMTIFQNQVFLSRKICSIFFGLIDFH